MDTNTNTTAPETANGDKVGEHETPTLATATHSDKQEVTIADPAPTELHTATVEETARAHHDQGNDHGDGKPGIDNLEDALKVIADLRKENARSRTNAKETAANEARNDIANSIAKALGIVTDDTTETPDPAEQVTALTNQVAETKTRAEQAQLELAVYKTAGTAGANPDALLDSRSFMNTIATIDPTDIEAVKVAVTDALTANPTLKATPAVGPNRIDHTPGGSGHTEPKTLTEVLNARYQ